MAVANTVSHFQQTIWSKSILRSLDKITSLRNHCDFKYEKDSKNAKEVKILSVNRPTIRLYKFYGKCAGLVLSGTGQTIYFPLQ